MTACDNTRSANNVNTKQTCSYLLCTSIIVLGAYSCSAPLSHTDIQGTLQHNPTEVDTAVKARASKTVITRRYKTLLTRYRDLLGAVRLVACHTTGMRMAWYSCVRLYSQLRRYIVSAL